MIDKPTLRRSLLKTRQALTKGTWQQQSAQICAHLQTSPLWQQAKTVLAYFSIRQEPDLSPLFCLEKTWGFPRCVGQALSWHVWSPQDDRLPLELGAFGIPAPSAAAPQIFPETVDLLLVPAVACDRQGYRLGYGGGFYDRLLSDPAWAGKPTIGIVFEFARLPQLPIDSWDRPLDAVCTEAGLFHYGADRHG